MLNINFNLEFALQSVTKQMENGKYPMVITNSSLKGYLRDYLSMINIKENVNTFISYCLKVYKNLFLQNFKNLDIFFSMNYSPKENENNLIRLIKDLFTVDIPSIIYTSYLAEWGNRNLILSDKKVKEKIAPCVNTSSKFRQSKFQAHQAWIDDTFVDTVDTTYSENISNWCRNLLSCINTFRYNQFIKTLYAGGDDIFCVANGNIYSKYSSVSSTFNIRNLFYALEDISIEALCTQKNTIKPVFEPISIFIKSVKINKIQSQSKSELTEALIAKILEEVKKMFHTHEEVKKIFFEHYTMNNKNLDNRTHPALHFIFTRIYEVENVEIKFYEPILFYSVKFVTSKRTLNLFIENLLTKSNINCGMGLLKQTLIQYFLMNLKNIVSKEYFKLVMNIQYAFLLLVKMEEIQIRRMTLKTMSTIFNTSSVEIGTLDYVLLKT